MTRPTEAAERGFDTMGAVRGHLLLTNCLEDELTRPNIELAMKEDRRLVALYRLLDALVDTMFPYLAAMDERIDDVQDQIFVNPKESQLAELFELKRQLVMMRKLVTPQRDMVSAMMEIGRASCRERV